MIRVLGVLGVLVVTASAAASAATFDCSPGEVGYFATFKVKPGKEDEFEQDVLDLTAKVRSLEPGAVFYAPYHGDEPGVYHFVERYRDEASRDAHARAEQIRAIFGKLMPLLREPLEVERISALCP